MQYFKSAQPHLQYRPEKKWWQKWWHSKKREKSLKSSNKVYRPAALYNPYKKDNVRRFGLLWPVIIIAAIFGGWIGTMLYLPYFQIKNISYSGLQIVAQADLENFINNQMGNKRIFPSNNFFLISNNSLADKIKNNFGFKEVVVKKVFPNSLQVNVTEKISSLIYNNGTAYYLLDQNGMVIKILRENKDSEVVVNSAINVATTTTSTPSITTKNTPLTSLGSSFGGNLSTTSTTSTTKIQKIKPDWREIAIKYGNFPILVDYYHEVVTNTSQIYLEKSIIQSVIEWAEVLKGDGAIKPSYFVLNNPEAGLEIFVNNQTYSLVVSLRRSASIEWIKIKTILKTIKPREYIDIRLEGRAYWK